MESTHRLEEGLVTRVNKRETQKRSKSGSSCQVVTKGGLMINIEENEGYQVGKHSCFEVSHVLYRRHFWSANLDAFRLMRKANIVHGGKEYKGERGSSSSTMNLIDDVIKMACVV